MRTLIIREVLKAKYLIDLGACWALSHSKFRSSFWMYSSLLLDFETTVYLIFFSIFSFHQISSSFPILPFILHAIYALYFSAHSTKFEIQCNPVTFPLTLMIWFPDRDTRSDCHHLSCHTKRNAVPAPTSHWKHRKALSVHSPRAKLHYLSARFPL